MAKELTTEEIVKKELQPLIDKIKKKIFINPEKETDDDTLGIIISKYCEWDTERVADTAKSALTDCNYHTMVRAMEEAKEKE